MSDVDEIVENLQLKFRKIFWYQKLSEQDYNIGHSDIIYCKIRDGIIVWELYQYG